MTKKETKPLTIEPQLVTKEDTDAILSAIKELTKAVGDLAKESKRWYNAGKM